MSLKGARRDAARPLAGAGLRRPALQLRGAGFLLRSLRPDDACDTWLGWIADAELMELLNMPARRLGVAELRAHIAEFDHRARHLLGLFDEAGGALVGIILMDINAEHRSARFNMFIGDRRYWGEPRLRPLANAFLDHLFEHKGIEKIRAQVATDNHRMIGAVKSMGLRVEGHLIGEIRSFRDGRRIDQFVFGLLKREWQERRGNGR